MLYLRSLSVMVFVLITATTQEVPSSLSRNRRSLESKPGPQLREDKEFYEEWKQAKDYVGKLKAIKAKLHKISLSATTNPNKEPSQLEKVLKRLEVVYNDAIEAESTVAAAKKVYENGKDKPESAERKQELTKAKTLLTAAKEEVDKEEIIL